MPSGIYERTIATRLKMSLARKGKGNPYVLGKKWKLSEEARKKMSERQLGNKNHSWKGGKPNCLKCGVKLKSMKAKHCKLHSLKYKEQHPNWIKDRSLLKRFNDAQKDRRSSAYVTWRKDVWSRDKWKCKINNKDCKGRLEAHHILNYANYPELRYDINNGITLCHFHHPKKREEEKRLSPYFMELVSVSKDLF